MVASYSRSSRTILAGVCALAIVCAVSLFDSQNELMQNDDGDHRRQLMYKDEAHLLFLRANQRHNTRLLEDRKDTSSEGSTVVKADNGDIRSTWYKDIDYSFVPCGKVKCYFFSTSDPSKGYLVERKTHKARPTYIFAKKLESEFHVLNLYSSPPFNTAIPPEFAKGISGHDAKVELHNSLNDVARHFRGAQMITVQPSASAPGTSRLFKCPQNKFRAGRFLPTLDYIINNGHSGFKEKLLDGLEQTIAITEAHPGLVDDFQFLIDLDGQIYHIDLDRALIKAKLAEKKLDVGPIRSCLEEAIDYVRDESGSVAPSVKEE